MLSTVFGNGDALGITLVVTIIGAAVALQRTLHNRANEARERDHELDKRMTLMEQTLDQRGKFIPLLTRIVGMLERLERDQPSDRSGIHKRTDDRDH